MTPQEKEQYLAKWMPKLRRNGAVRKFGRSGALGLELQYVTLAKDPDAAVAQQTFNGYGHKDKVTKRLNAAAETVLAVIKANGEMTTNQVAAATGMKPRHAREALNYAVLKGFLHRDSQVRNNYRFSLPKA